MFQPVSFCSTCTRSTVHCKLIQQHAKSNKNRHLYFFMTTKALECTLLHPIISVSRQLKIFMWSAFLDNFNPDLPCMLVSSHLQMCFRTSLLSILTAKFLIVSGRLHLVLGPTQLSTIYCQCLQLVQTLFCFVYCEATQ